MEIKHYTETLPGIIKNEVYELENMKYVETFDDITGQRMYGEVFVGKQCICSVYDDGTIRLRMALVCKNYH